MAEQGSKIVKLEQPRYRAEVAIGRPGLKQSHGRLYEEWLPALEGIRGIRTYTEMSSNEPVIGGFLFAITSVLTAVEWHAEPLDTHKRDDIKASDFLQTCLRDTADTWGDFVAEALSLVTFGWSFFEVVYKKREGRKTNPRRSSRFDDSLWGWQSFEIRSQEALDRWEFDDQDRLQGMWQRPPPSYKEIFIPLRKAVLFRLNPRKTSPEGSSLLRACYRPWFFKKRLQELEAIGIERNLAGMPVLYLPSRVFEDPEYALEFADYKKVITNLKRDEQEGVLLPGDRDEQGNRLYELTLLSTGSRRQSDTNAAIQRYSAEIAMAALSDFMLLGHGRVGTFALGVTKTELFATAFNYVLDCLAAELNEREVPRILALNGMPGEARLVHGRPGNVDIDRFSAMIERLVKSGMPVASKDGKRERFIFETLGLPAGDVGEDGMVGVRPPMPMQGRPTAASETARAVDDAMPD